MAERSRDEAFVTVPMRDAVPPAVEAVTEAHVALAHSFPFVGLRTILESADAGEALVQPGGEGEGEDGAVRVVRPAVREAAAVMLRSWVVLDGCATLTGLKDAVKAVKRACDAVSHAVLETPESGTGEGEREVLEILYAAEGVLHVKAGLVLLGIITLGMMDHSVALLEDEAYWHAQALAPLRYWVHSGPLRLFEAVAARYQGGERGGGEGEGGEGGEGGNVAAATGDGQAAGEEGWLPSALVHPLQFVERWRAGEIVFSTEVFVRETLDSIAALQDTLLPHLGRCSQLVSSIDDVCQRLPAGEPTTAAVLGDVTRFTLMTVLDMAADIQTALTDKPTPMRFRSDEEFMQDLEDVMRRGDEGEGEEGSGGSASEGPTSDDRVKESTRGRNRARMYLPLLGAIAEASHASMVMEEMHDPVRMPSHWFRRWPHYLAGAALCLLFYKQVFQRRATILAAAKDGWETVTAFVRKRVVEPMRDIYATIRYDDSKVGIMSAQSLAADTESLKRMVEDFLADHGGVPASQDLSVVLTAVEAGDITVVMREYESGIRKPISGLLFGSVLRTILIQVQKQKVDVDRAMTALDQIMRSNELNFQLIAAIPALLIVGALGYEARKFFARTNDTSRTIAIYADLRSALRRVEIMLHDNDCLSLLEQGALVVLVHNLWVRSRGLSVSLRRRFEEDLRLLLNAKHGIARKMATLRRMYRQYSFLAPIAWTQ